MRSAFRECRGSERARPGSAPTGKRPGCGVCRGDCAGAVRRFCGIATARWGVGETVSRRYPGAIRVSPTLRALFALAHRAPLDAVERLQTALPYDFALPGTAFFAKFGGLYPAYVRGEAYVAAGRGEGAAVEFQKVLNHRGIVLADPIGALAHLQLGRAYVLSGENAKAKSAYEGFLTLWKDADPDIPILNRAKAEYAKLQ